MKQTISEWEFVDAFDRMGREDNFSRDGRAKLFDYLTELEEQTESEMELDVIGLCCEFTEYESIEEYNRDHGTEHEEYDDIDETMVIPIDDESFIIQDY